MKTLSFKIIPLLLFAAIINIACEHCDDEDYARKERERNETQTFHSDSLSVH